MNDDRHALDLVMMGMFMIFIGTAIGFWFPVYSSSAETVLALRILGVTIMAGGAVFLLSPLLDKSADKKSVQYGDTW